MIINVDGTRVTAGVSEWRGEACVYLSAYMPTGLVLDLDMTSAEARELADNLLTLAVCIDEINNTNGDS